MPTKRKRGDFNKEYLKKQIKLLYGKGNNDYKIWFAVYKKHGGKIALKEIIGDRNEKSN